ncbi:MAG: hypothetical protein HQL29_01135 [Candidatus Omnitrophica bacterium]|nr:hypothetical protein [Candidatus Omnitrophota bacterium]
MILQKKTYYFLICLIFSYVNAGYAEKINDKNLLKAEQLLYQGEHDKALEKFKELKKIYPKDERVTERLINAYNVYGYYLYEQGRLPEAIEQFNIALIYDDENVMTNYSLARLYYLVQNIDKAKKHIEIIEKTDPKFKGLESLKKVLKNDIKNKKISIKTETPHFIVTCSGEEDAGNLNYIKTYLEEAYGVIGKFLDHFPDTKTVVILYTDADYDELLQGNPYWSTAIFDGKLRVPSGQFEYTKDDIVKTIYHEYAHLLVYDMVGKKIPDFISEGISSKAEDFAAQKDRSLIRDYLKSYSEIDLAELIASEIKNIDDRREAIFMYIKSYLFVEYIIKIKGKNKLKELVLAFKNSNNPVQITEKFFSEDLSKINTDLKKFVEDEYSVILDA